MIDPHILTVELIEYKEAADPGDPAVTSGHRELLRPLVLPLVDARHEKIELGHVGV